VLLASVTVRTMANKSLGLRREYLEKERKTGDSGMYILLLILLLREINSRSNLNHPLTVNVK
jgi:hypothetical protein